MKTSNKILLGTFAVLLVSVYSLIIAAKASIVEVEKIEGNGNVVTIDRPVDGFDAISVSGGYDVILSIGEPSLKIEGEENLMDMVRTEVKNGVLKIEHDNTKRVKRTKNTRIYVSADSLTSIRVSAASNLNSEETITADRLSIGCTGSSETRLKVVANFLKVDINASGYLQLSGTANDLEFRGSASSLMDAFDLMVKTANMSASSACTAKITVEESLEASASSSGEILFKGNPSKDVSTSSAGSVRDAN